MRSPQHAETQSNRRNKAWQTMEVYLLQTCYVIEDFGRNWMGIKDDMLLLTQEHKS